ncbi:hypothetical protein JCM10908_001540 [Rhodotorula pacifica]|uniref:Vsb1p n=1 Tax=Rhodotorula pacifica TaxID=1495444 RepID=UPI00317B1973
MTDPPAPPSAAAHPSTPSGSTSAVEISRRRSLSRSSQRSGLRSSLGGKPVVPIYSTSAIAAAPNESAISDSDAGSLEEQGIRARIGSFSATREEIRDGSARLASLSLADVSGFPVSPNRPTPRDVIGSMPSPSFAPLDVPADLSQLPPAFVSADSLSQQTQSGPSAFAPHASKLAQALAEPPSQHPPNSGGSGRGHLSPILSAEHSPTSIREQNPYDDAKTPKPADLALPEVPEIAIEDASPSPSSLEDRTPTPAGPLLERANSQDRSKHLHKPIPIGDETAPSDEEADEDGEDEEGSLDGEDALSKQGSSHELGVDGLRRRRPSSTRTAVADANERTPLLGGHGAPGKGITNGGEQEIKPDWLERAGVRSLTHRVRKRAREVTVEDVKKTGKIAVGSIPAVILGTLMNILDALSYGLITYPTSVPAFANFGGIGYSQFFVSCIVAQLVFSGGGSIFDGGNGSMMIEVVPFYHAIVGTLQHHINDDETLVATTMFAFAMSTVLTGLAFGTLGYFKLGRLSEFFPRHILVGTIGGVGAFLIVTGLEVSTRTEESDGFSLEMLQRFFSVSVLPLWTIPLALAIILRIITSRYSHPLIFPIYFLSIPAIFYAITLAAGVSVETLRDQGWVFEAKSANNKWYEFWTLYDLRKTDVTALIETLPNQLALVFFGLLHVPINVPSLAISIGEDNVDTNRELVAHGVSNLASGMIGSVPNYLVYVNSLLFYQNGGTTRISGFMLSLGSLAVLLAGPSVIGYLPICVVAALIFILGFDLVKEALWDTYGRVSTFEYGTIWIIVAVMTIWDFTIGLAVGLILACVSFVILSSRRRAIRAILTGDVVQSCVRRHPIQSSFLKDAGRQIRIIKLQGFLFFGTISNVEIAVRKILDAANWSTEPIRYLVVDFSSASGVDFSAAEAFVRMQRLLDERGVVLVLCGCPPDSEVGNALRSVGLWSDSSDGKVVVLENLNDALEHCENAFLRSLYSRTFRPPLAPVSSGSAIPITSQIDMPKTDLDSEFENFASSPRANHLRLAAKETITKSEVCPMHSNFQQPLPILLQSFKPYAPDLNEDYFFRLVPYFTRVNVPRGATLWSVEEDPDAFYVIESGMLRAVYILSDGSHSISESMVAGTVAGELSFLSRTKRNTNVVAERDSVLWKMDVAAHERMGKELGWATARKFEETVLKIAVAETEVLMGHLMSSL